MESNSNTQTLAPLAVPPITAVAPPPSTAGPHLEATVNLIKTLFSSDPQIAHLRLPLIKITDTITIKLDSDNYLLWKSLFQTFLTSHDLLGYVDGSVTVSSPNWSVNVDATVRCWMIATISHEILHKVGNFDSSRDVWLFLENYFMQQFRARQFWYMRELGDLKKGDMSCDEYLSRIKYIADHLDAVGSPLSSVALVMFALRGLPDDYSTFATVITVQDASISFDDLRGRLIGVEQYILRTRSSCVANSQPSGSGRGRGDQSLLIQYPTRGPTSALICQICGVCGHSALRCSQRYNCDYVAGDLPRSFSVLSVADTSDASLYYDGGTISYYDP